MELEVPKRSKKDHRSQKPKTAKKKKRGYLKDRRKRLSRKERQGGIGD